MSSLDQMTIVIGPPKVGKTTYVRQLVVEHLTKYPSGIALVHDSNGDQFRDICAPYDNVAAYRDAVAAAAESGNKLPRGSAFLGFDSSAIRSLAVEIGTKYNAADVVQVPILLVFDETSMMESSGSTWIDRDDLRMVATRRHLGIAPVYNCQREAALTQAFFDVSTDVLVFSQNSIDAALAIEKKIGLAKGSLAKCVGASKFLYAHWHQGAGLV